MEKRNLSNNDERFPAIRDMLLKCISGSCSDPSLDVSNKYIQMFSFFMYHSDIDYAYNIPFLPKEHEGFRRFLGNAKKQYCAMQNIISLLSSKYSEQIASSEKNDYLSSFRLSLNEFLQIYYDNGLEISFCDQISFSGGNRTKEQYVYTLYDGKIPMCFKQTQVDEMIQHIYALIETSINTDSAENKETK